MVKLPLLLDKGISRSALFRLLLFPEALTNCLFSAHPCKIQILSVCVHTHTRALPSLWRFVLNSPVAIGCYKQFSAILHCFFACVCLSLCVCMSVLKAKCCVGVKVISWSTKLSYFSCLGECVSHCRTCSNT